MTTGATGQLGLALPVQGELSGTWGDTVNNGLTQYINIAIAGTLTLTGDGAVTLANTTGDASASNVTSTLTGAGTVTAQFAIVRVTGTLTVAKVVTGPSYSKTYTVVNAATGGIVTFKASGQTGVSVAVGESAFVYFNGTDYVKLVGTATAGAAGGSTTQVQYNNAGVLAGITGATTDGTALTLVAPILGTPTSATLTNATGLPISTGVSGLGTGVATFLATPSSANLAAALTDETGTGSAVFATSPTLVTPVLGTPTSATLTNATGLPLTTGVTGTLPTANGGTGLTSFTSGGVVYASSSSALATGSVFTFDGANAIINATTPAYFTGTSNLAQISINRSPSTGAIFNASQSAAFMNIDGASGGSSFQFATASAANTEPTESMRLTSTSLYTASGINVGIGLSNPAYKLDVSSGSGTGIRLKSTGAYGNFIADNTGTTGGGSFTAYQNGAQITIFGVEGAVLGTTSKDTAIFNDVAGGGIKLYTNASATPKAILDSAGNLGLGVTPSAWDTVIGSQVGRASIYGYAGNEGGFQSNCYFGSGDWRHIANGTAEQIRFESGEVKFRLGASGTAGGVVSFTQAMTLGSDGNLAVGTTSTSGARLKVDGGATSGTIGQFGNAQGGVVLGAASSVAYVDTTSSTPLAFKINGTERARITSDGSFQLNKASNETEATAQFLIQGGGYSGYHWLDGSAYYIGQNSSVRSLRIYSNSYTAGVNLASGGTSWGTFSDERLKYDIEPITNGLDKLSSIRCVSYRLKDVDASDSQKKLGIIAQDLVGVVDEVIDITKRHGDETDYLSVRYTELIPVLIKSIQEQQAIIESLKARLDAANL